MAEARTIEAVIAGGRRGALLGFARYLAWVEASGRFPAGESWFVGVRSDSIGGWATSAIDGQRHGRFAGTTVSGEADNADFTAYTDRAVELIAEAAFVAMEEAHSDDARSGRAYLVIDPSGPHREVHEPPGAPA